MNFKMERIDQHQKVVTDRWGNAYIVEASDKLFHEHLGALDEYEAAYTDTIGGE